MNLPTKITFSRIIAIAVMILTLVVLYFIGLANPNFVIPNIPYSGPKDGVGVNWLYFGLFIFFLIASFTDYLDGHLARKNNQVTDLGKFLDPVADKLLINSMVIFLIVPASYAHNQQMNFSLWCALLLIVRDIVVDALRFIAAQKGVVIAANIFGKMKTVFEMIAVSLVLLNGWPFIYFDAGWLHGLRIADFFVYAATLMSVISGVIYVAKYGYVLKEGKKNGNEQY